MPHSNLQFGKTTVTKTTAPDLMRIEVAKTRRAHEIGGDCGLFRAPKVLDYDEAKGTAVFERLEGIQPVASRFVKRKAIAERIGRSLAVIHKSLSLPPDMVVPLPPEFARPGTEVFIHGDFNGCNVCVDRSAKEVVIIDWQTTSRHGGRATFGSRYFDLLWFVNYLLWTPKVSYLLRDPVAAVAESVLRSYFEESGISRDTESFRHYAEEFFAVKLPLRKQHSPWRSRWLLGRSNVLTQRFIQSIRP